MARCLCAAGLDDGQHDAAHWDGERRRSIEAAARHKILRCINNAQPTEVTEQVHRRSKTGTSKKELRKRLEGRHFY